jgi:hypothetical protein
MIKIPSGPTLNANVVQIARDRFKSAVEAREALHKAVDNISDELLRDMCAVQVLICA